MVYTMTVELGEYAATVPCALSKQLCELLWDYLKHLIVYMFNHNTEKAHPSTQDRQIDTHMHMHTYIHSSYITLSGVHEMHGQVHPN